jgi:flagellar protein FliO/FliZ
MRAVGLPLVLSPAAVNAAAEGAEVLGAGQLLRSTLSLAVVLGLILLCAWLFRRLGGDRLRPSSRLQVLASTALGARERLALVEVDGHRLLLAVAPGQVTMLRDCGQAQKHTPLPDPAGSPGMAEFGP